MPSSRKINVWLVLDRPDMPETNIYAEIARLGVNLTVVHSRTARPDLVELLRSAGAECLTIEFRNRLDFAASAALRRELKRRPCDVIYATVNKPLAAVLRATIGFPKIKVVGYRGTLGHLTRLDPSSWLTYFHPGLDHIVAVSDAVKGYFTKTLRMKESMVTRIYKGHDVAWYQRDDVPVKDTGDSAPLRVGFVGQIRHVKGVEYLLDAMKLVPPEKNVTLTLIGGISDGYLKRRIAHDTANDRRIIYLGFRKDAPKLVSGLDVTVMPTVEREGLAKAVIESMAQGIPAIVSNVGGLPELVANDETGIVVPPRDARAIADAIIKLADNRELLRRFGAASRERIREHFDYRESARQFKLLFERLSCQ